MRRASGACGLLLDTYHMNIEEKDPVAAATAAGAAGRIAHVHACGTDRGARGLTGSLGPSSATRSPLGATRDRW